ncbi:DUF3088 domain-containing protein [Methylobacterium frigidaeris]|uniref:DUF3088 domain-containing protein n=1 Tax=Methylobacterium frigidaeris TaxID=2038277 RepID=A0AA37HDH2_9HYPH|nr:DUF3088 domain-containing protein [Methylobacterium frigidaeris]PIK74392.1 hypothetical protein CS379_02825 [Methylobacterium frigidaeris]GJD63688.1 hypothetical protein MPEAHAMD_3859 [Methylobacterium frigidaeris]
MLRDHLYLLAPDFTDPAFPGRRFYCWHCALIEGVLAGFPALAGRLDVTRLPWPHPRQALVDRLGEGHQSLPLLILAPDAPDGLATGRHGDLRFVDDKDAILRALHARHGFPEPHP